QQYRPHILLTDIRMPCMDGLELTERTREHYPQTKVILMTAYHDYEYALTAIELGVSAFILKPSDPEDILQACQKASIQIEEERKRVETEDRLRRQVEEYKAVVSEKTASDYQHSGHEAVVKVIDYINKHYMEEIT